MDTGYLVHARKKQSAYSGGFVKVGNRLNNSSAYNHDYYMKNKQKWAFGSSKKKNIFQRWKDMAIDKITDFMVDLSVVYINKLLKDPRIADMKVDQIVYDKFSPVVNKMVDEAVDRAVKNIGNKVKDEVSTQVNNAANNTTQSVTNYVNNLLNPKKR